MNAGLYFPCWGDSPLVEIHLLKRRFFGLRAQIFARVFKRLHYIVVHCLLNRLFRRFGVPENDNGMQVLFVSAFRRQRDHVKHFDLHAPAPEARCCNRSYAFIPQNGTCCKWTAPPIAPCLSYPNRERSYPGDTHGEVLARRCYLGSCWRCC